MQSGVDVLNNAIKSTQTIYTHAFMVRLGGGECLSSLGVDKKNKRRELTDREKDGRMDGQTLEDPERRMVLFEGRQWRKRWSGSWMQLSATGNAKLEKEGDSHKKWGTRTASTCSD